MKELNADEQGKIKKKMKNGCTYDYTELAAVEWREPSEEERAIIRSRSEQIKSCGALKKDGIFLKIFLLLTTFGSFYGTFCFTKVFGNPAIKSIGMMLLSIFLFVVVLWMDLGFGYVCIDMFFLKTGKKLREMIDAENYSVLDVNGVGYYESVNSGVDSMSVTLLVYLEYNGRYIEFQDFAGSLESEPLFLLKLELERKKYTKYQYIVVFDERSLAKLSSGLSE